MQREISRENMERREPFSPSVFFHPGTTLEEKLREMGMGIKELAERTSIPERVIWDVTNGDASISPEMAVSFEQVTHIPARLWMKSQHLYDEYVLAKRPINYLDRISAWERTDSPLVVAEE